VAESLRKKVKEDLERLQKLGIIHLVQFADWAAPVVPVLKGDGKVCICGDYKTVQLKWTSTPFRELRSCLHPYQVGRSWISHMCKCSCS